MDYFAKERKCRPVCRPFSYRLRGDSPGLQRTVFLTFYEDCVNVTGYLVEIVLGNSSKTCCSLVVLRSLLYGRFADRRFVKGAF